MIGAKARLLNNSTLVPALKGGARQKGEVTYEVKKTSKVPGRQGGFFIALVYPLPWPSGQG